MSRARYGWFTVRTECSHCGQPLPLNAPAQQVNCAHCLRDVRVPDEIWRAVFDGYERHYAQLPVGERSPGTFSVEGLRVRYEYAHGSLACEKCGKQFGSDSLAVGDDRDFSCRHCGDPASAYRPPAWLAQLIPTVVQLYSIDPGGSGSTDAIRFEPPKEAVRPVVMACPQCSGSLSVTVESDRILACRYCRADIYLPDEVWRRLHPVKTVTPFFVRFEGMTRFELAEEQRVHAAQAAQARDSRERAAIFQREQVKRQANQLQHDSAVAKTMGPAWGTTIVAMGVMACFTGWTWLGKAMFGLDPTLGTGLNITYALGWGSVLFLLIGMGFANRPVQRRTKNPGEWVLFVTWFWMFFGLVMPVIGQLMALWRMVRLAWGRVGSFTVSSGQHGRGGSNHYKPVVFHDGESHPAAVLFFCLLVLWPLALFGLFGS